MLTKQELTKKKAEGSKQLDLVDTLSSEDNLRRKRMLLSATIFLTIGLSLVFWVYRAVKSIRFSFQLSVPSMSSLTYSGNSSSYDTEITKVIADDSGWNITLGPKPIQNWSHNRELLDETAVAKIYQDLSATKPIANSVVKSYLPEGVIIKEQYSASDNLRSLSTLIITPQKEILLVVSDNSSTEESFRSKLVDLIPLLYWNRTL